MGCKEGMKRERPPGWREAFLKVLKRGSAGKTMAPPMWHLLCSSHISHLSEMKSGGEGSEHPPFPPGVNREVRHHYPHSPHRVLSWVPERGKSPCPQRVFLFKSKKDINSQDNTIKQSNMNRVRNSALGPG